MLTISDITYRIGGRTLLEGASVQINAGWKVGLIGRNGTGKSTLLDLMRGVLQPDGGEIALQKGARIGFLAQEAPGGDETPLAAVLAADEERARLLDAVDSAASGAAATHDLHAAEIHDRLNAIDAHGAPARAAGILAGLGFDHAAQRQPLSSFSGGWRMRVALAAALFAEPDLLLLDEPTNHLDLEAALWLEAFLRDWRRTLILISHDRDLLDHAVDWILHLERGKLALYRGGYTAFERQRRERQTLDLKLAKKQEAERKRLTAFVDRFRAKATKA